jgi:hypothetical protein
MPKTALSFDLLTALGNTTVVKAFLEGYYWDLKYGYSYYWAWLERIKNRTPLQGYRLACNWLGLPLNSIGWPFVD